MHRKVLFQNTNQIVPLWLQDLSWLLTAISIKTQTNFRNYNTPHNLICMYLTFFTSFPSYQSLSCSSHITSPYTPNCATSVLALAVTSAWSIFLPDIHLCNIYHLDISSNTVSSERPQPTTSNSSYTITHSHHITLFSFPS